MTADSRPDRRNFLTKLGLSATVAGGTFLALPTSAYAAEGVDHLAPLSHSKWDTSWVDRLKKPRFRTVIDASTLESGYSLDVASAFLDDFRDVYGTTDEETRAVIVIRRLGTPLAFNDVLWERYAIGEDTKTNDPTTKEPAKRNPYLNGPSDSGSTIAALRARGTIFVLCNVAMTNWSRGTARKVGRPADEVRNDVLANLIPGVTVVPTGLFALIRAQNAGCAYMRGT
jgi:intracellular sulfur oxidation DsrE/DsrF family protein